MQTNDRGLSYLWDMYTAANEIVEFIRNCSLASFTRNKLLRYAVERQLLALVKQPGMYLSSISKAIRKSLGN